jgi:hypothetical protein
METTKTNLITELSLRVYNKLGEQQLTGLLMEGKPLMTHDELTQHIRNNLNDYLNNVEQKQLIIDNIGIFDNEDIKSSMIKLAIEMAAVYVKQAIENALTDKDFVGNNLYTVQSNPKLFMMHKYFDEELGIKFNIKDSGLTAPI